MIDPKNPPMKTKAKPETKLGMKPPKGGDYSGTIWKDRSGTKVGTSAAEDSPVVPYTKRNVAGEKRSRDEMLRRTQKRHRGTSYDYTKPNSNLREAAKKRLKKD